MEHIKVKIINRSGHELPAYETPSSAGMDVRASLKRARYAHAHAACTHPYRPLHTAPHGYECQIRPRSGLALKKGISLVNTPGTVDADYRGEIGVILINLSDEPFVVNDGERICQMVIKEYTRVDWEPVERLDETVRGDGGFGHTGVN